MLCAMMRWRGWAIVFGMTLLGFINLPAEPRSLTAQGARPNIVLMFPDNLGWGEVGAYGSVRGNLTPRLDRLASEGIRLNNFNVEFSCTVSRAALMTGRYAIRSGATQPGGITLWEVTIAEALKSVGYATALFGKWHLGGDRPEGRREPSHQGFDEFYGIPRTSNEAQTTIAQGQKTPDTSFIWEGKAGQPSRSVKPFDMETRRTHRSRIRGPRHRVHGAARARANAVLPLLPDHADSFSDAAASGLCRQDRRRRHRRCDGGDGRQRRPRARCHRPAEASRRNTIVFWCTDNGAEQRRPWRGSSGPWSGFYNTVMEGGIRTPCIIRWPGRIPAGRVSNEIVHEIDLFPTLAAAAGADIVPKDRAIDGVNQLPFLEGKQAEVEPRARPVLHQHADVRAVKWHDWKFHYTYQPEAGAPPVPPLMRLFNLLSDPKEETDIKDANPWAQSVMDKIVAEFTCDDDALSARAAERAGSRTSRRSATERSFLPGRSFGSRSACRRARRIA